MRLGRRTKKPTGVELLDVIPHDLIVEILSHVVSASKTPTDDIKSLRITCKGFYSASKAKEIGRNVAVRNEWRMHWWDKEEFFELLNRCASCGNLEANFILGLEKVFNRQERKSGMEHLLHAIEGGCPAAIYIMGIILFRDTRTRSLAMELLSTLPVGDHFVARCRKDVFSVLRKITWKVSAGEWLLIPMQPCTNQLCGRTITNRSCLDGGDLYKKSFCSQECRWMDEYYRFFENL